MPSEFFVWCSTHMDIAGGAEWNEEENRLIAERKKQAGQIIVFFETSGADFVSMSFIEDDASMAAKCVSLFGRDLMVDDIFWSIN